MRTWPNFDQENRDVSKEELTVTGTYIFQSKQQELYYHYWQHNIIFYKHNNFNQNLHYWHHNKNIFIINYLLLYVLNDFWRKISEDGDNAETCSS